MNKVKELNVMTDRRKYLLGRIPQKYNMDGFIVPTEPPEIRSARKKIEAWDEKVRLSKCAQGKVNEALIRKAREAVYFESEEKALAIIRQCEKMLTRCR